jgi:hypothetical protein
MKKWLIIIGLLLLLLMGGFFVFTSWIMPKAAVTFLPAKWQNIPLGQKRITLHEYLDQPDSVSYSTDLWRHKLNNTKQYILNVGYGADSTAINYNITYEVKVFGFINSTEVRSDSL